MADQNRENIPLPKPKKVNAYDQPFGTERTSPFDAPPPQAEARPEPTEAAPTADAAPSPEKKAAPKKAAPKKAAPKAESTTGSAPKAQKKAEPTSERVKASTAAPLKTSFVTNKKDRPAVNMDVPRSARVIHQIMPYLLIGLGIFVGLALLLNLFCNWQNKLDDPNDHWMGIVGYGICYGLFGCFGPAAFALPLLLINLGAFWKRYIDHKVTVSKIVASLLFLLMLSSVIHVFCLMGLPVAKREIATKLLLSSGAAMTGGGVVGGTVGYFLYSICRFVGALIIGFLLLFASFFYFLGMTPEHLWSYLRSRRSMRGKRTPSYSKQSAEEAENRAKMEEKIRRTTSGQMTIDDADLENGAPLGAVRVVKGASPKKNPADKMAPMPVPRLDPNDGDDVFVPEAVTEKLNREGQEAADAAVLRQSVPSTEQKPAPAPASTVQTPPVDPAANRDAAVEPIFPRSTESRTARKMPRSDRNFDLKSIFVDIDETDARAVRQHVPVPPEAPLRGTRPVSAQAVPKASAAPATKAPAQAAPTGTLRTPATGSVTVRPTAPVAQKPAAGQKPLPKAPAAKAPAFSQVAPQKQDFGLSNEEFERLEAQQPNLPRPGAKKPAAGEKAPAAPATKTPSAKPATTAPAAPAQKAQKPKRYVFPPISYLHEPEPMSEENRAELEASMNALATTLKSFHVGIEDNIRYACGPTVTRYEITPAAGVRVRTITNLSDDIALSLRSSGGVRIEAPIPGTNAVGIEVPNKTRSTIYLRELIESKEFRNSKSNLTACLGAGIAGEPLIFDIAKMPHLLIAGTTGSGKSVCINCIVMSLLYKVTPDEVKLVMIDPKKVEFSIYKNIPHLMAPVVTTPKDAAGALQASVEEMERRFELFEQVGVRDLKGYNTATADDPDMPHLPHIVIIIDELADLMMTARDEVETAICRIAQKARAAGMHLLIGTQRPSADVVTGLIKSNVPSRIAFTVKSQVDSRVILDHIGAESLTGRGDMLFVPIGSMRDMRVQGAFVDDKEVEKICEFIRATNGTAVYDEKFISKLKELAAQCGNKGRASGGDFTPSGDGGSDDKSDPKYADAVRIAIEEKRVSTSLLQRKLEIGYSRAAKLIDRMQSEGYVSPPDGSKPRTILITPEEYLEKFVDNPDA